MFKNNLEHLSYKGDTSEKWLSRKHHWHIIDICFKLFLNRIHILKEKVPKVEKKPLQLVFPYLGTISLETRTKFQSPSRGYLTAVNYRLSLKVKINSVIDFALKSLFPKFLHQVWFVGFSVDYEMNPITENVLYILL